MVPLSSIYYVEAAHRYVRFVTADRTYTVENSLTNALAGLPHNQFCRIHRRYVISLRYARQISSTSVRVGTHELPIGRNFRGGLWRALIEREEGPRVIELRSTH